MIRGPPSGTLDGETLQEEEGVDYVRPGWRRGGDNARVNSKCLSDANKPNCLSFKTLISDPLVWFSSWQWVVREFKSVPFSRWWMESIQTVDNWYSFGGGCLHEHWRSVLVQKHRESTLSLRYHWEWELRVLWWLRSWSLWVECREESSDLRWRFLSFPLNSHSTEMCPASVWATL